jgi:hypothetical protein
MHWILETASVFGGENTTVLALWDGSPDGQGGVADFVAEAKSRNARIEPIGTKELIGTD